MIDDIVRANIGPFVVYSTANLIIYLECVRHSIKSNSYISSFSDHLKIGIESFRQIWNDPSFHIVLGGSIVLYTTYNVVK